MSIYINNSDELTHWGIKGQKWGVRRYQNKDGSLTPAGEKRYAKQQAKAEKKYEKEMNKYHQESLKTADQLWVKAYNKTADEYDNKKIDEYNRTHNPDSKNYMRDLDKQYNRDWQKNFESMRLSEMQNNRHYQKAKKISEKYGLKKVDELSNRNEALIAELREAFAFMEDGWVYND